MLARVPGLLLGALRNLASLLLVIIAVPVALVASLLKRPLRRTREEVASLLRARLSESYSLSAWDEFLCVAIADPRLEAIRNECISLEEAAINEDEPTYLTTAGRTRVKGLLEELE